MLNDSLVCIGSTALKYRIHSFREPKDLDLVGRYNTVQRYCFNFGKILSFFPIEDGKKIISKVESDKIKIVESEIAYTGTSAHDLLSLVEADPDTLRIDEFLVPSLDVLYLLKMSHRYLRNSPSFFKTMEDIHYLRQLGAKIRPEHIEFFKARAKETYNYQHPKLNVDKKDFFVGDGIQYVYDHDSIHEAIKHLEVPAYQLFQADDDEVFCQKELFESLSFETKNYAVLEEAYVLALERSQIPYRNQVNPEKSLETALIKICTSITSGWFREYAWEHWSEIWNQRDLSYADRFFEKAENGLVKLYT